MPDFGTLDFLESFDYYPTDVSMAGIGLLATWLKVGNNGIALIAGRFAPGKGIQQQGQGGSPSNYVERVCVPETKFSFGIAVRLDTVNQNLPVMGLMGFFTAINDLEQLKLSASNVGVPILTIAGTQYVPNVNVDKAFSFIQGVWHYVEYEYLLDVAGYVRCYIDGTEYFNIVGDVRTSTVEVNIGRIRVGCFDAVAANTMTSSYDDLYRCVGADTRLGENRIELLEATGDSDVMFTRLSGATNAAMINEASADGDTSYNSSNTVDDHDLFAFVGLTTDPTSIHGVGLVMAARKEDAGTRTIRTRLDTDDGSMPGDDRNLQVTYAWSRDIFPQNNGVDWTKAKIATMKPGYQLIL